MSGILFGSISTIADTSELQREAFNEAFAAHGLDWQWDRDDYKGMLSSNGGAQRIADFAASRGEEVDAAAVHQTKSELFQQRAASSSLSARDGVVEAIRQAKDDDLKIALVTTTSPENIAALLGAVPGIEASDFDLVVDSSKVQESKPDAAAYTYALEHLSETSDSCVAIEDNVGGVRSAVAAGLRCVAFPNANTVGHAFEAADASAVVDRLDYGRLRELASR